MNRVRVENYVAALWGANWHRTYEIRMHSPNSPRPGWVSSHPQVDEVVPGSVMFEWFKGGHFLIQHSHNDHELFPDGICVIGRPEEGDGLVMEYCDSRGVRRTYGLLLGGGVLRIWRDHPGFDQRFAATLGPDAFEGRWQLATSPGDWKNVLKVIYPASWLATEVGARSASQRAVAESRHSHRPLWSIGGWIQISAHRAADTI